MRKLAAVIILTVIFLLPNMGASANNSAPTWQKWKLAPVMDQGTKPQCTAYALYLLLKSAPYYVQYVPPPQTIYEQAQLIDGPGRYAEGVTASSAIKYTDAIGITNGALHTYSVKTAAQWLKEGPILVSGQWYAGFDYPQYSKGIVLPFVRASGPKEKPHVFVCYFWDQFNNNMMCQNSWGRSYAYNGKFRMSAYTASIFVSTFPDGGVSSGFWEPKLLRRK